MKAKVTFVLLRIASMYFRSINSRASTCTFWRALEWTFLCDFRLIFRGQRYFVAICVIVSDLCSDQVWLTFMPFLSRFSLSSQQCCYQGFTFGSVNKRLFDLILIISWLLWSWLYRKSCFFQYYFSLVGTFWHSHHIWGLSSR